MPPIVILDSEDDGEGRAFFPRVRRSRARRPDPDPETDGDSSETLCEEPNSPRPSRRRYNASDFLTDEEFSVHLTELSIAAAHTPSRHQHTPEATVPPRKTAVPAYSSQGKTYRKGKSVELHDGTFLRICEVLKDDASEVFLRGPRFQRLESMDSLVPRRINELCWIVNIYPGDNGLDNNESDDNYEEVGLSDVKGLRRICLTNHLYPAFSAEDQSGTLQEIRREGILYCRCRYTRIWDSMARKQRIVEEAITFLSKEEADPGFQATSETIRHQWRGTTRMGGSYVERQREMYIDLSSNGVQPSSRRKTVQSYTFGDGFCGAGGVSRGALQAGLKVQWGFDFCDKAMDSYRLNFPTAEGWTCEVADFLTNDPDEIRVDVLHFSPPCKTFSPAKTVAAATDDANEACIFSTRELLDRVKPRIATMEETAGLQERHIEFLYATIHNFVDLGYSLRWGLLECQNYGVPQRRKRLVIIGSGPGETLPSFPPSTHGPPESGRLPYRTISDTITNIPNRAPNHDPQRCVFEFPKRPYDGWTTFAKTVTCNGGENYHPSGARGYTHREAACLQTFPLTHRFCGVGVLKQIGNAVPPMLAKTIFRQIIKSLERTDGVRGRRRP